MWKENPYKKLQDNDFHWYWIPKELVDEFHKRNDSDYDSDDFDESKYDEYRTWWHPDCIPDFYNKSENKVFKL